MLRAFRCRFGWMFFVWLLPTICHSQTAEPDHNIESFLTELNSTKPKLAEVFKQRLEVSQREIDSYQKGHLVFGRVVLEDGRSPRAVISQMILLEDGSFVDAIGVSGEPIGFRLHGYEPVNVTPKGPGPSENLGVIRMKRLPANQLASATGQLIVETRPGAPRLDNIQVTWSIAADPVNTPHNGTEGLNPFHQIVNSEIAADGSFTVKGMSPGKYYLTMTAPNCVMQNREIVFAEGESKKLLPISVEVVRKMNVEFAVSGTSDFRDAMYSKTVLKADDRWRASDDTPPYACDLMIGQIDGKLMLRHVYGPCHTMDLGPGQLSDQLDVDLDQLDSQQNQNIPVEDGHVYLVHQASWKHWIVLRTTLDKPVAGVETSGPATK